MKRTALQQCSSPMLLIPAYGKVYVSRDDMHSGWLAGDTFRIMGGPYCSVRDWEVLLYEASSHTLCDPRNPKNSVTL